MESNNAWSQFQALSNLLCKSLEFPRKYEHSNIDSVGRNRELWLSLSDTKVSTNESERILISFLIFPPNISCGFQEWQLPVKRNHPTGLELCQKSIFFFQTPITHDFSPCMPVHSGENLYKEKIVFEALFLHPFTHSHIQCCLTFYYVRHCCRC